MKKTPLKRYTPLKSEGNQLKRGGRLRYASTKRKREYNEYSKAKKAYLALHPNCERCKNKKSEDIHHKAGRVGQWLCRYDHFAALCRGCHDWVHQNGKEARRLGWIIDTFHLPRHQEEGSSEVQSHSQNQARNIEG